jgi:hypothetical protein
MFLLWCGFRHLKSTGLWSSKGPSMVLQWSAAKDPSMVFSVVICDKNATLTTTGAAPTNIAAPTNTAANPTATTARLTSNNKYKGGLETL